MTDFHAAKCRIERLLCSRGFPEAKLMDGKTYGLMPKDLFVQWSKPLKRQKLIKKTSGPKEFERFVAQVLIEEYNIPATFSNKIKDLPLGGDYDVLAEGIDGALLHFETKTGKKIKIPDIWNFMIREAYLAPDLSVFLYDVNFDLRENLLRVFSILYSLVNLIKNNRDKTEVIEKWFGELKKGKVKKTFSEVARSGNSGVYFLYWPLLVINGGGKLKKNIAMSLRYFYAFLKYRSPTELSMRKTRLPFYGEENWDVIKKLCPRGVERIIEKAAGY